MSRRRGRDRYRPSTLKGLDFKPVEPEKPTTPIVVMMSCVHGIPWRTCDFCSKPRSTR